MVLGVEPAPLAVRCAIPYYLPGVAHDRDFGSLIEQMDCECRRGTERTENCNQHRRRGNVFHQPNSGMDLRM